MQKQVPLLMHVLSWCYLLILAVVIMWRYQMSMTKAGSVYIGNPTSFSWLPCWEKPRIMTSFLPFSK